MKSDPAVSKSFTSRKFDVDFHGGSSRNRKSSALDIQKKLIGKGGHAEVYKGCLADGQIIAVKKITKKEKNDKDRVGDFLTELGIIAHINHQNAAKLIGFSAAPTVACTSSSNSPPMEALLPSSTVPFLFPQF
ncbi:non-specific serine,threonine protein kinase [Sarracenia purpurea var. burkii]